MVCSINMMSQKKTAPFGHKSGQQIQQPKSPANHSVQITQDVQTNLTSILVNVKYL